jgi:hypothetical protein
LSFTVPILLKYQIGSHFHLEAGPQFAFILDKKNKVNEYPFDDSVHQEDLQAPAYDKFDFGVAFGISYQITDQFDLNARYFRGLLQRDDLFKSSVINIGLGYGF